MRSVKANRRLDAQRPYEVAAMALQARRYADFLEVPPGLASGLHVVATEPTVTHEVTLVKVRE